MYSNIYNYNTLFKIKTNPRLNICKNKNKIDSTEKPENIIYYLEDGNMYCFTIDNLYQQFEEQNFINENTGKLFDMRFVEYFKNRYNIILKSRGFLEFGDKYGFSIEEKIKKIKKKKSKIKIDIDLEKIIEEDIKNLENLLIEDYETNLIENEIKKDEMIGDKDLDNKVISKKEDIIGNGSEKDDNGSDNEDSGSEKDDSGSDNEDSGSDNEDSGSEKDDSGSDNEGKEVNKNEDKKIKELCKYCSKNITKKLKTIIFNKDKSSKIVNFCSFKCFENHDEFVHK